MQTEKQIRPLSIEDRALNMSEEKYRILFDSMDEGYCIIQMLYNSEGKAIDFRYLRVNKAFERNNGLQHAEGKTIKQLAPNIENKWIDIYDQVAQTGIPMRFEEDSVALNRVFSLYAFSMAPLQERKVAVIFTDITERKKAEAALRESEERYRAQLEKEIELATARLEAKSNYVRRIAETVPGMVSVMELDTMKVEFINASKFQHEGYDIEEINKKNPEQRREMIYPADRQLLQEYFAAFIAATDEETITCTYRARNNQGIWQWYHARGKVFLRDAHGRPTHIVNLVQNIQQQKQNEETISNLNSMLNVKNRQLASINSELETFNSIAANDYQQSLKLLYTALEAVITKDAAHLSDASKGHLRRAQSSIQKLKLLTEDIVAFSRISMVNKEKETVELKDVVTVVLEDLSIKANESSAMVKVGDLPSIEGYPLLLSLLFHHLLDNAIKFRNKDTMPYIHIAAGTQEHEGVGYYRISVQDNGIGFPETEASKIFDMFHRLHEKQQFRGSGIGLAICRKVMDLHGGFIQAESHGNDGSTFSCYFPVQAI